MTTISRQDTNWEGQDIYEAFDLKQRSERTERQIFQGNLLKAYEKYPTGKFLNYTDHQGNVRQGLVMPASFDIQESLREQPVAFQEPRQVKAFLTELTQHQGAVKTPDEVLTIKSQAAARFGHLEATGFVLQTPKSAIGDRFSLDQSIIAAAGSDFYSVSDRMEVIVPQDRIDQVLQVLMQEQNVSLVTFDFKEKAREYLGVKLPELQQIQPDPEPESLSAHNDSACKTVTQIAPANEQTGKAEKNVARFLLETGLAETVLQGEDFHLRIENEPYIPLVLEWHGNQLFLTHYLEQNGDIFIDSEMVFRLHYSKLQLQETAVQDPFRGREHRACDRSFANLFSQNILHQGFGEAAKAEGSQVPLPEESPLCSAPVPGSTQETTQMNEDRPEESNFDCSSTPKSLASDNEYVEQAALFSLAQFESTVPATGTPTGFDQTWNEWERQNSRQEPPPQEPTSESTSHCESSPQISAPGWKQLADRVRDIPLPDLAQEFGLEQDRSDKAKWRTNEFCISINNSKFFDHYAARGGVGAIDFTMHIRGYSFQEAIESLSGERSPSTTPAQQEEKYPRCNVRDESKWQMARSYLVDERKLPATWVDKLHQEGLISVDSRQNVMFFRHQINHDFERGEAFGANLRGTIPNSVTGEFFKGLTTGTTREEGYFWFQQGDGQANRLVITEAPIDAISYAALNPTSGTTIFLSTDGQGVIPTQVLQQVLDRGGEIVLAHDHDRQGERMAWQVAQQFPQALLTRETPATGKDWNEQLLGKEVALDSRQEGTDKLWKWYGVAAEQERSQIIQTGLDVNAAHKPRELTPEEITAMEQALSQELQPSLPAAENSLAIAAEILRIAEQAYAYSESIGRLQSDGEFWSVSGNDYTLSYAPSSDYFSIEGRNGMGIQSFAGKIEPENIISISERDLDVFRETEKFLNQKGFNTNLSLQQIQEKHQRSHQLESAHPITSPNQNPLSPTLKELRAWYRQARDLGRSETHLNQIEQVGKAFIQGQPLSERSLETMTRDKAAWNQQVQKVVHHARFILSELGQPTQDGTLFTGKQYSLYSGKGLFYALAKGRGKEPSEIDRQILPQEILATKPGVILKLEQDTVSPATRITSADALQFERFAQLVKQRAIQPQQPTVSYDR